MSASKFNIYETKTWFHSLTTGQLRDLCRAVHLPHHHPPEDAKSRMIKDLCETKSSSTFASATVVSIKDMCRSRSLPISGLKYQLVLRVLSHDTLQMSSAGNDCKLSIYGLYNDFDRFVKRDSAFKWLAITLEVICYMIPIVDGVDKSGENFPHFYELGYQTPIAALRDAESAFTVFLGCCTPNAAVDSRRYLSTVIDRLRILVVEARVFMLKTEKKRAVKWILELNNFLSEFMLDHHFESSLKELIKLLENDNYHLPSSSSSNETKNQNRHNETARIPFRSLENVDTKVVLDMSSMDDKPIKPQPKEKIITSNKEIVYKKMVSILQKSGVDSDKVYRKLVRLMKSIQNECDYYETLRLFRSVFTALVVHFEKIVRPGIDNDHNFTLAIDLLGDVVENVLHVLSYKEKQDTSRWMTKLRILTKPHGLADIAEISLGELISMVKESMAEDEEPPTRRTFSLSFL